jgi:hypothetical protein
MPFDALTPTAPEIDLSKPSLAALEHVLRHQSLWPAGFTWNYCDWRCCAEGLAAQLWGRLPFRTWEAIAERFGITVYLAQKIFSAANLGVCAIEKTTPERVADVIARVRGAIGT